MIQPKTALEYAKGLKELLKYVQNYCGTSGGCKQCKYKQFIWFASPVLCNPGIYIDFLTAIIKDLEGE
jgi:hypothetical protein